MQKLAEVCIRRPVFATMIIKVPRATHPGTQLAMASAISTPAAGLSAPLSAGQPGADDGQPQQHHREAE